MIDLPILGAGVVIDRLTRADAEALAYSHSDPDNARFQGWQSPLDRDQAERFIAENESLPVLAPGVGVQLAIRTALAGPLRGDLYLHRLRHEPHTVHVGITISPGHHGNGHAHATLDAVAMAIGSEPGLGVTQLVAEVDIDNLASLRLFRVAGFREIARRQQASTRRDGSNADEVIFTRPTAPALEP